MTHFMDVQGNRHDFSDPERFVDPPVEVEQTYEIRRFYRDPAKPYVVVERGLTLTEARAWCQREDTHNGDEGWFDGYEEVSS